MHSLDQTVQRRLPESLDSLLAPIRDGAVATRWRALAELLATSAYAPREGNGKLAPSANIVADQHFVRVCCKQIACEYFGNLTIHEIEAVGKSYSASRRTQDLGHHLVGQLVYDALSEKIRAGLPASLDRILATVGARLRSR